MIKRHLLQLCVLSLVLAFTLSTATAQSPNSSSMIVTVVDQNGAIVRGANVSVVNTATGATREAVSGDEGTATILDNETGTISFQADQSNDESVSPTVKAVLTITASAGSTGTIGLDRTISVTASDVGDGSATDTDDYSFTTTALTFTPGDGSSINSSTATITVVNDKRLEGDETVNLTFASTLSDCMRSIC